MFELVAKFVELSNISKSSRRYFRSKRQRKRSKPTCKTVFRQAIEQVRANVQLG